MSPAGGLLMALVLGQAPEIAELQRAIGEARARLERQTPLSAPDEERLRGLAAAAGGPLASDLEQALRDARDKPPATLSTALARLARRVEVVRAEGAAGGRSAGGREALARVLARREFASRSPAAGGKRSASGETSWWERLLERISEWLERQRKDGPAPGGGFSFGAAPVAYAVLALVLALSAVIAWRRAREARGERRAEPARPQAASAAEEALSRPPEDWLALSERHLAAGDLMEAVRALYLALLVSLHRAGAIEVRPGRTNWEHARRLATRLPGAAPAFRGLTSLFDRAVYGRRPLAREEYAAARAQAEDVLAAAARPPDGGSAAGRRG